MARAPARQQTTREPPDGNLSARAESFKANVLSPERRNELRRVIPAHVSPDRFERNLTYAVMKESRLLGVDPVLVFQEVAKVTALGFLLDPQLGEAYVIVAYNGRTKQQEPQARIGYRGLMKLAKQSGEIAMIYASEVCEHDVFKEIRGDNKRLIHEPDTFGNRGSVIGYYGHVTFASGLTDFETMTLEDVHRIRNRSDGWKAFVDDKIASTPWKTDENEMAKKTAIRRLCKRLPQSPELAAALTIEDEAEHSGLRDVTPPRARLIAPPSQQQRQVAHKPAETMDVDARLEPERETVPAGETQERQEKAAPEPRESRAKAAPAAKTTGERAFDPDKHLETLRGLYAAAKTELEVGAIWKDHVTPHADDMLQSDFDAVGALRDEAVERVRRG